MLLKLTGKIKCWQLTTLPTDAENVGIYCGKYQCMEHTAHKDGQQPTRLQSPSKLQSFQSIFQLSRQVLSTQNTSFHWARLHPMTFDRVFFFYLGNTFSYFSLSLCEQNLLPPFFLNGERRLSALPFSLKHFVFLLCTLLLLKNTLIWFQRNAECQTGCQLG